MNAMTIRLPDSTIDKLNIAADRLGVPVDELIAKMSDDFFERNATFESISKYVLEKNAELYRRLAK